MKIAVKASALLVSMVAAHVATLGVATGLTIHNQNNYRDLMNQTVEEIRLASLINEEYKEQSQSWDRLLLHQEHPDETIEYAEKISQHAEEVDESVAELLRISRDQEMTTLLEDFGAEHEKVTTLMLERVPQVQAGGFDIDDPTVADADEVVLEMADEGARVRAEERAQEALAGLQQQQRQALMLLVALSVTMLVAGLAVGVRMALRIGLPLARITRQATENSTQALPEAVDRIGRMTGEVEAPEIERFTMNTKDELDDLAAAMNSMQDSSLALAVQQRRTELNAAETLVNLGRRNQSLLTRTLGYLGELERHEKDSGVLAKLYRLDHVVTRVRRNMESMLVLAGVEQTRTHTRPVPMQDVLRAAMSEIEDFRRITVHHMEPAVIQGGVSADLAHLVAELLENGAHFSPADKQVLVTGRAGHENYTLSVIDEGLGMTAEELEEANRKLATTGRVLHETHVLGHTLVARLAERHGLTVRLVPSAQVGVTAQVTIPNSLLVSTGPSAAERRAEEINLAVAAPAVAEAVAVAESAVAETAVAEPAAAEPVPVAEPVAQVTPAAEPAADVAPAPVQAPPVPQPRLADGTPRRVRGANLGDLAADLTRDDDGVRSTDDLAQVRRQFSGLQASVARARAEADAANQTEGNREL